MTGRYVYVIEVREGWSWTPLSFALTRREADEIAIGRRAYWREVGVKGRCRVVKYVPEKRDA